MLIIRLQRVGARNNPDFRIVLSEKHRAASKKVIAILGQYNPRTKNFHLRKPEQLQLWLGRNIEISPTVRNLLITHKLLSGSKAQAWRPKKKRETATADAGTDIPKKQGQTSDSAPSVAAGPATSAQLAKE